MRQGKKEGAGTFKSRASRASLFERTFDPICEIDMARTITHTHTSQLTRSVKEIWLEQ